ncbi:MAG TPA: hypothetical protein VGJ60_03905 [Chloroflexota bacterium]|jgi:hypothetical protein
MSAKRPAAGEPRVQDEVKREKEERPPQQEELRCSICHKPSCSR